MRLLQSGTNSTYLLFPCLHVLELHEATLQFVLPDHYCQWDVLLFAVLDLCQELRISLNADLVLATIEDRMKPVGRASALV